MLENFDNKAIESKCKKYWEENGTYKFDESSKDPIYSIDTPPPFTSGQLHMGHVLSYSYFDFVARYKRMRGFNVYYPQGWDTQGFPTEVKVEKKFGRLPPAEFREKCVEWTKEFIAKMKSQMNDMGFSPDWSFEYRTMDPEYHKKVQYSLIKMYKDKMVYRAKHPVYWCPRCVSAIAKAETEDLEREGLLNYILFKGPEGEKLEIATTRPELMHACVAVMFHPSDERYKKLDGKEAETALGKKIKIFADKDVDKEFGTGLMMVCTFGDKEDVVWTHRYKLPVIEAMDQYGKLINSGKYDGLKGEQARKQMIEDFKAEGKITKQEKLPQTIKVHDRCKKPIELKSSMQWFANVIDHKDKIKEFAEKIKWAPEFGIHYMIDWLDNIDWDWVISRHRVFGTPLPFYYCEKCNNTQAAEESELPFSPERAKEIKCKCGELMKPEPTVADVWIDSSITPLIISKWNEDEKFFKKIYPISLRPQGVEIVRTWAFYTIYRSGVALTGTPPFKEILLNGNVLATDGRKMSKSLGNVISPEELEKKYPVDAIRQWAALSGAMAKDRPFSYEDINRSKRFLLKLWNASKLIQISIEDYTPGKEPKLKLLDRWILGKLNELIKSYTDSMEKSEFHSALHPMHEFFWHDVCDNYLEYIKHRIYQDQNKDSAQYVLYNTLYSVLKLLSPFIVFTTEEIYRDVFKEKEGPSIHRTTWPEPFKIKELSKEEKEEIELFNEIVSQTRQYKASNRLSQSAELEKLTINSDKEFSKELLDDLKSISKIKNIETKKGEFKLEF